MSDEFNRELISERVNADLHLRAVGGIPRDETLRASAQYARVDGRWYESAHRFSGGYPVDQEITLFSPDSGDEFLVPGVLIESMEDVTTRVRYRALPWRLSGLWSRLEKPPVTEPNAFRLRRRVAVGTDGVFARLPTSVMTGVQLPTCPGHRSWSLETQPTATS